MNQRVSGQLRNQPYNNNNQNNRMRYNSNNMQGNQKYSFNNQANNQRMYRMQPQPIVVQTNNSGAQNTYYKLKLVGVIIAIIIVLIIIYYVYSIFSGGILGGIGDIIGSGYTGGIFGATKLLGI